MAESDIGGAGAVQQATQQQQTTITNAEMAALKQHETVQEQVVAAQTAPPPEYLKKFTPGAAASQYESVPTGQAAPWEQKMLLPNSTQYVANPNYDPNWFATHGPTIYAGFLYVPAANGAINPGTTYQVAPSNQQYGVNAYGTSIGNVFYDPSTVQAPPVSNEPVDPLYLTWVGGRTPSLSAVQTPGSVLYTGPRNFTGAGAGSLASVLGYGAGYSGDSSATGGSTPASGETATSQNDRFFGRGEYAPKPTVTPDIGPSMAGTPVPGAPGMYFTGDIATAPVITTNTRLDAGGSIPTPYTSNAATARSSPAADVKFIEPQYSSAMFNSITGGLDSSEKARVAGPQPYTGPSVLAPVVAGGVMVATGLSEAGKAWYETVDKTAFGIADAQSSINPLPYSKEINNAGAEAISFTVGGIPAFVAGLPKIGVDVIANPAAAPAGAVNFVGESIEGIKKKNEERPGAIVGDILGFAIAGKATGRVVETGAKYSPVGLDIATIPTAEGTASNTVATVFTRNPLSTHPAPPRAFVMAGSEIEGIQYGRGSPVPTAVSQGISAQAPALFNVRDTSITATPAQVRFLDPFFREVSKGSEAEPIVNAIFDLKQALPRSEAVISYEKVQAQPLGSAKQLGVSPETNAQVFETLAETAPETRYAGSRALAETIGEKYVRSVAESDIDLSMPKETQGASFEALKEVYAQEPSSTVTGSRSSRGYSFTSDANPEHVLGVIPETTDVRTYNARTAEGSIVKTQKPEYSIESKASRTLGPDKKSPFELTYSEEQGTTVKLGGKKPSTDLADIYAASRGIARAAYQEKYYDLGKTYEGISENVKTYAEATGNAEKIATIPEDALVGVQKTPIRPGQVLGINLDIFPAAEAVEYPLYKAPKESTIPTLATPEVSTKVKPKDEVYPETKVKEPNPNTFSGKTPEDYATTKEPAKGPNENTFSGWTPSDYATSKNAAKEESTTYPSAKTADASSTMLMSSSYAAESAPAAISSYAAAPAAYTASTYSGAMYPGVATPYAAAYPLAGPPQVALYPVGYPRGGETTYPTTYPTPKPAVAPAPYPNGYQSNVSGRPIRGFVPEKTIAPPYEDKFEEKTKRNSSKGKRFGEVFSFDVDKNFKTPARLLKQSSPKRFKETFAMDTKNTFNKSTFGKLNSPFESIKSSKNKRSK